METNKASTIDEYIAQYPQEVQKILNEVRATIKKAAPQAQEKISYLIPTFTLNGTNLIHFAAFAKHIGLYPTPSASEEFKEELSRYKTGKGSVQFPLDKPMPFDLITRIVQFRLMLSSAAKDKKKKRKQLKG